MKSKKQTSARGLIFRELEPVMLDDKRLDHTYL